MSYPGTLEQNIVGMHGAAGRVWLADLPRLVARYAEQWDCRFDDPFTNLSFNYVAPGERVDGTPVVLKLGYDAAAISQELAAVRLAGGRGMIELVAEDAANGAILLRRAMPGDTLIEYPDDEEAIRILARTMVALWQRPPADHPFPSIADWGGGFARMRERFDGGTGPLPTGLTTRAERIYTDLLATSEVGVVLHGDLHHHNVLRDGEGWSAIDPKGVVGEPAFEVGALMRNRLPDLTRCGRGAGLPASSSRHRGRGDGAGHQSGYGAGRSRRSCCRRGG